MYFDPPDLTLYDPDNFNRYAFIKEKEALTVEQANKNFGQLNGVNLWRSFQYFVNGFSVNDFTITSSGEIESTQPATFSSINALNYLFVNEINIVDEIQKKRDIDDNDFPAIILNGYDLQESLDSKRDIDNNLFTEISLNGVDLQTSLDVKRNISDNSFNQITLNGVDLEETVNTKRDINDIEFPHILLNGNDLQTLIDTKRDLTNYDFLSLTLNQKSVATEEFVETRVSEIIGGVPLEQLDTIYELGDYLQSQDNELSALVQLISTKASVEYADTKLTLNELQSSDISFNNNISFAKIPISNTIPTENNQLVNKAYVDTKITLEQFTEFIQTEDISFNGIVKFANPVSYISDVSLNALNLVPKTYVDGLGNSVLQASKDYADSTKLTTDDLTEYIENSDITLDGKITFTKPVSYFFDSSFNYDLSLNNLDLVPKQYLKSVANQCLLQAQQYADTKFTEEDLLTFLSDNNIAFNESNGNIILSGVTKYSLDSSFNFDLSLNAMDLVPKQFVQNYVKTQFDNLPLELDVGLVEVGQSADAFIEQDETNVNKWLLNLQLPRAQGFTYKYEWTNNTTYFAYDVVRYDKDTYICIVPVTTNFSNPIESDEWDYFAIGGIDGINGQDATGGDSMLSAMTTAIVGILAQSALNFVAQGIISGFQNAMMNMLKDKINDQIDDAVDDAMDQIDEENIKRKIKHIDAEPFSFTITDELQPYTSISSQLKIVNEINTANITLHPEGNIECKNIANSETIETSVLNINNDLNVTDKAVLLGDTFVSHIKPLLTDITETIPIDGNIYMQNNKKLQTNNITTVGDRDKLLIKAPYLTFDIDLIEYNVDPNNPFDSLLPTDPQIILFKQLPQVGVTALEPQLDLDMATVKYVKSKVEELKTDLETKLDTTNTNVDELKTEVDGVKERIVTLEENVTNINNRLDQVFQILESLTSNVEALTNELSDIGRLSQFEQAPPFDPANPDYNQIYESTDDFNSFNPSLFRRI